jgi:Pectate lyase superfamily protein
MKANSNQVGKVVAVVLTAGCCCMSNLPYSAVARPAVIASEKPVSLQLPPGVSGDEIQKALNSLPASGGEVVLPPETFSVRQPIILDRDNVTLRGSGSNTVLRLADNANCPVIIMGDPVSSPKSTVKNLCVRDLAIDGNRAHQTRELWKISGEGSEIRNNGITIQSIIDSSVKNVISAHNRSGGLVTTLGVRRLTVKNYESFDNEFDGLACYLTEDSNFSNLNLHDNPGAGISLDLAFNHNVVSNAVLKANDLGIFMRSSHENNFYGVAIHGSKDHGVFMAHAENYVNGIALPAPMTECTQNSFTNLTATNCGGAAFRVNNVTCTHNVIVAPKFNGNRKGGLSEAQPDLVTVR